MSNPLLKWVGGKRKLVNEIISFFPEEYNRYIEPFAGGAAVFFSLSREGSVLSDINTELINFYRVVRDNPEELMENIDVFKDLSKEFYLSVRSWDREKGWKEKHNEIQRATRFLFLNKTAFSGMWRENKNGQMNVPYGKYKNPKFYERKHLLSISQLLRECEIYNLSYEKLEYDKNDLVYIDPPYLPVSETSSFASYTENGFSYKNQVELADFCKGLNEIGVYFVLSNSFCEPIFDLYKDFKVIYVSANRAISTRWESSDRKVNEILVTNIF